MYIKSKNIRLLFIIGAFFLIPPTATAQGGPPPPGDGNLPGVSIDNGLSILLVSGLLLALYTIRKPKNTT